MHHRFRSVTLSQLPFPAESNPNFPWEKSHWDNTVVKNSIYIYKKKKKLGGNYVFSGQGLGMPCGRGVGVSKKAWRKWSWEEEEEGRFIMRLTSFIGGGGGEIYDETNKFYKRRRRGEIYDENNKFYRFFCIPAITESLTYSLPDISRPEFSSLSLSL